MGKKALIVDPVTLDLENVIADAKAIRALNPQRHEMEQLTAVVLNDAERGLCAGYKEITTDEFWVRGHMPGMPLMPGVVMCEAAAQLSSYHCNSNRLMEADMIGFGGLDEVRFRGTVVPGQRLIIVALMLKIRPRTMVVSQFQCFVGEDLVCEGKIRGIPLPLKALNSLS